MKARLLSGILTLAIYAQPASAETPNVPNVGDIPGDLVALTTEIKLLREEIAELRLQAVPQLQSAAKSMVGLDASGEEIGSAAQEVSKAIKSLQPYRYLAFLGGVIGFSAGVFVMVSYASSVALMNRFWPTRGYMPVNRSGV